ncbi:hypothetical protein AF72_08570 [Xylella taiwanensis]|uniref:Uncharacterized protein n=1 Tax=Xylella taiwanensis TaxID=1444770 RepID=Z9JJ09_9GAMM|nr:hypothetical protein AF72_08570 [Xylella taiwanensis]
MITLYLQKDAIALMRAAYYVTHHLQDEYSIFQMAHQKILFYIRVILYCI